MYYALYAHLRPLYREQFSKSFESKRPELAHRLLTSVLVLYQTIVLEARSIKHTTGTMNSLHTVQHKVPYRIGTKYWDTP